MSVIYNFHKNVLRLGLSTGLGATMLLGLAACGGTTGAPLEPATISTIIPALMPTPVVTSDTGTDLGTAAPQPVATGTVSPMDMSQTSAATQTPAGTTDLASATPSLAAGSSAGAVVEIKGTLREWAIDLSQKEVAAGKLRFTVTNAGQFSHNFTIKDASGEIAKTPNFAAGAGLQTLEVDLKPGTYTIICDLPGHASRGQKTELVVR